jgi:DNA polymerase V
MIFGVQGGKTGVKSSGFASPAQGYEESSIDFNALLVQHPAATFFFGLASGDMEDLGLPRGALLVVDRSKKPVPNDFVLLVHEGRFLCRLMVFDKGVTVFTDGSCDLLPVDGDTAVVGVVTGAVQVFGHDFSH